MLGFMNKINKDVDVIRFFPHEDEEDAIEVYGEMYKEKAEPIGGTSVGPAWHVVLFQWDEKNEKVINEDKFEAIFSDPREYISGLIPQNWYGILARKTTKSEEMIQDFFDNLKKVC